MKSVVHKIPNEDMNQFVNIVIDAYPGLFDKNFTVEDRQKMTERLINFQNDIADTNYFGLYRGQMFGGMRIHNFIMNYQSIMINAGVLVWSQLI